MVALTLLSALATIASAAPASFTNPSPQASSLSGRPTFATSTAVLVPGLVRPDFDHDPLSHKKGHIMRPGRPTAMDVHWSTVRPAQGGPILPKRVVSIVLNDISVLDTHIHDLEEAIHNREKDAGAIDAVGNRIMIIMKETAYDIWIDTISESDGQAILRAMDDLIAHIESAVSTAVHEKAQLASAELIAKAQGSLVILKQYSDDLTDALVAMVPAKLRPRALAQKASINNVINIVISILHM